MRWGQEDGYDAIFVSPHKFMGGPGTAGLLLMSKSLYLLKSEAPSTCGGGLVDFVNFDEQVSSFIIMVLLDSLGHCLGPVHNKTCARILLSRLACSSISRGAF